MRSAEKLAAGGGIAVFLTLATLPAFGQSEDKPRFLAADVHVNAKTGNQGTRPPTARGDFYEIKNATMADLINYAYDLGNTNKVVGGPSWLEMDHYDVAAKQPQQTAPDKQRLMLQSLLAERFKLVSKEDTRPMPTFALVPGTKSKLKEADGSGETGCKPQSSGATGTGILNLTTSGPDGTPVRITLADGMIDYRCRNMTMAAFADGLRGMLGANLGTNPVVDQTGLTGAWNFDFKYSIGLTGLPGGTGSQITVAEAVDKQLGLKLEERQVPMPVVVVESVNQRPIDNPPGTAEALPGILLPKEFEVATIKPTSPDNRNGRFQMQPGGRLNAEGVPLTFLIQRAFNPAYSAQIVGIPTWAGSARFDVVAQTSSDTAQPALDADTLAPMMLALLKDRFKLTLHTEQRELPAYDLAAGKPKMKKADPSSRSWCKAPAQVPGAPPAPQGSQALICQNITMAQFAELLRGRTPELDNPVQDLTGIQGGWDFRLTFNPVISLVLRAAAEGGAASPTTAAAEPIAGISLFEAVDKQLGLKLEKSKRNFPVTVIDHIDQTPSEN
ncbi:MAG: TIGR03435 family protein [Acidobacteriota bacterium]